MNISWSAPADDGGADITSYDLRYIISDATDKADGNWTEKDSVWSSGALKYTVGGLTAGTRYDFQLRAVNSAGAGSWSATVKNVDPSPPGAPTFGESSEETPGQLWVSWDPSDDDGGAPVTHYDLRHIRSDAEDKADANWTQVDDLTEEDYWIVGLTSGVRYDVQVRAANRAGDGSWSGTKTLSPKFGRPNPPGNISVTPGDGTLTVRWSAAPAKSGVTVAGYKVSYIRTDHPGIADFDNWTTTGRIAYGTLEYAITGLVNGVSYTIDAYSISARGRTSPPPAGDLPTSSPGRAPAALGGLKWVSIHVSSIDNLVDRPLGQRRTHRHLIRHPPPPHERSHERRQAFGARPGHHCRAGGGKQHVGREPDAPTSSTRYRCARATGSAQVPGPA